MINSCNKGKTFERTVCTLLTEATGFPFIRTANSGAYATIHADSDLDDQRGDITYDHKNVSLQSVIECKHIKKIDVVYDMYRPKSELRQWIHKLYTVDAKDTSWILIVRMNNREILYFTDNQFYPHISTQHDMIFRIDNNTIYAGFFDNFLKGLRKLNADSNSAG